jgi:hypothetical protein
MKSAAPCTLRERNRGELANIFETFDASITDDKQTA